MIRSLALLILVSLGAACGQSPAQPRSPSPQPQSQSQSPSPELAQATAADEGLVLPTERYAVGDRFTFVAELSIKSVVQLNAVESIRYDRNQDKETTTEVLDVDAQGKPSRTRVTFTIDDVRSIVGRKAQRETSLVAGKTFLVAHSADAITVTDENGRTPPKNVIAAVQAHAGESAIDRVLERMFGGRRWYEGQRVELGAEALEAFNRAQPDPRTRYTSYAVELQSFDARVATFAIAASFDQGTNNGPLTIQLTGTREVDVATGRTLRETLRGPVRGHLGAPLTGEATMSFRRK